MSAYDTIEPDVDDQPKLAGSIHAAQNTRTPVVLTPSNHTSGLATTHSDAESGIAGIFRQSAHPLALFFLYIFRIAAIVVYIMCGWVTDNYVLSTVVVVVLLAMDFWNCRNVSGRTLVGLRFWNQVDEDGDSYWVFESRDPSRPANPVDSKMFWTAVYSFPLLWVALLIVSIVKLNFSYVPIVILSLVFNFANAIGFTYADRDAKQRWANSAVGSWGIGGIGGQLVTSAISRSVGKIFS
ncbi:Golgi apparatus membrane protein TVP23 [Pleurotus pulmonarius]|nr:Golgi apparatus membrane protein tvp23 [Pleurotus pulmonarius]